MAESIRQAKREYDEALALRELPVVLDANVAITWLPLVIVVSSAEPVLAVVALSLF